VAGGAPFIRWMWPLPAENSMLHRSGPDGRKPQEPRRARPRIAVGRADAVAKALGLGIGLLLGFFVLSLAQMPGSLDRQADLERRNELSADAWVRDPDQPF
jgi:hypothetical protein